MDPSSKSPEPVPTSKQGWQRTLYFYFHLHSEAEKYCIQFRKVQFRKSFISKTITVNFTRTTERQHSLPLRYKKTDFRKIKRILWASEPKRTRKYIGRCLCLCALRYLNIIKSQFIEILNLDEESTSNGLVSS